LEEKNQVSLITQSYLTKCVLSLQSTFENISSEAAAEMGQVILESLESIDFETLSPEGVETLGTSKTNFAKHVLQY